MGLGFWFKISINVITRLLVEELESSSYNKDSKLRSRSAGRAGRAMGNGSFERSWTPHERLMLAFLIFALPALPGSKIALPPL